MPIEEKERSKWLMALEETAARTPHAVKVVMVADRESDFFEFLSQTQEDHALFLIRARTDRRLVPDDSAGHERLLEALVHAPKLGSLEVRIPGTAKRKARTATVAVKSACVALDPLQRRGQAKDSVWSESIGVNVIGATDEQAPEGVEPVSWVLLTNLPASSLAQAAEKVDWYGKHWGIETWHKVLKSGCQVERCLLETAERLSRYLRFLSIIGERLMHVATLARVAPQLPATEVFSPDEIEARSMSVSTMRGRRRNPRHCARWCA